MKVVNKKWIFDNLNSSVNTSSTVSLAVKKIIQDIKKNKDVALLKYVKKFENKKANLKSIIITKNAEHCNQNGIAIGVGVTAQIDQAYSLGVIKTAEQRNADFTPPA